MYALTDHLANATLEALVIDPCSEPERIAAINPSWIQKCVGIRFQYKNLDTLERDFDRLRYKHVASVVTNLK